MIPMSNKFTDWTLAKRLAGKYNVYSKENDTFLCNQLYLIGDMRVGSMTKLNKTVKICCCECSYRESYMLSTWYSYKNHECIKCGRKINDIYNRE